MRVRSADALTGRLGGDAITEIRRHEQRVFRVTDQAYRRAIAGVEDDAVSDGNILQRLRQQCVETILQPDLLGNRLARVLDNVEKHDAANEGSNILIFDHRELRNMLILLRASPTPRFRYVNGV